MELVRKIHEAYSIQMDLSYGGNPEKMPEGGNDWPLIPQSIEIKWKCNGHKDEASSFYQKMPNPLPVIKSSVTANHYTEPYLKRVQFKHYDLGRKYDGSIDFFDHIIDYLATMHL